MWEFFSTFLAQLLNRRDDCSVPHEGATDPDNDDSTPDGSDTDWQIVTPVETKLPTVGVWCGRSSLRNPERDVEFALKHNINRFDIVVNDHSKWRTPKPFNTYNKDQIVRLAKIARAYDIEVHLMSWVMPDANYLVGAKHQLTHLMEETEAVSLQWDAEEPWTQGRGDLTHAQAAKLIGELFSATSMGVNGIGYASKSKLGPFADVCEYIVPQAYATRTSGLDPSTAPSQFYRRWSNAFKKPVVMGLAAYRQSGIVPGFSEEKAIRTAARQALLIKEVDTLIYWSLYHIRKNPKVATEIAKLRTTSSSTQATV